MVTAVATVPAQQHIVKNPLVSAKRIFNSFKPENSGMSWTRTSIGIFLPSVLSLIAIPSLVCSELLKNPQNNKWLPPPGTPLGDLVRSLAKAYGYTFSGIMACQTASGILQYSPSRTLGYAPLMLGSVPYAMWNNEAIDAADALNYSQDPQAIAQAKSKLDENTSKQQNYLNIFYTLCMIPTFFYSLSRLSQACRFGFRQEDKYRVDPRGAKSLKEHWEHIKSGEFITNGKKELSSFIGTIKELKEDIFDPTKARGTAIGKNPNFEEQFLRDFGRKPTRWELFAGGAFPSFANTIQIFARAGAVFSFVMDLLFSNAQNSNAASNDSEEKKPSMWKQIGSYLLSGSFWLAAITNVLSSQNGAMKAYGGKRYTDLLLGSGIGYGVAGLLKMTPLAQTPLPNAVMLASSFGLIFGNTIGDLHCVQKGLTTRVINARK